MPLSTLYKVDPRTYVPIDSITFIESVANRTILHLQDGRQVVSCRKIGYIIGQLPYLIRIHRYYAVNKDAVEKVTGEITKAGRKYSHVVLSSGKDLRVSQRYQSVIESRF